MDPTRHMTPGSYLHTAAALHKKEISKEEFFRRCLAHLDPHESGAQSPEDSVPLDKLLGSLFWKGSFGPVAAAIKLCESEELSLLNDSQGRKGETLLPVFSAAAEPGASLESVRSLDSFSMLSSALFRQALIVTALRAKNDNLARDITEINPSVPPPVDKCVFTMKGSRLVDDESIPAGVYNALIKHGWASPSHRVMQIALSSPNGADGVALLDTLSTKSFSLRSNPLYEKSLPQLALGISQLEVLQYIWSTFNVSPTPESLVQAVEFRDEGGVDVMRWLVDEHGLDVNYVLIPAADYGSIPKTDPRDRAEREHAEKLHARSRKKTALHAAAYKGNADAVSFLLERGADLDAEDGSGRTALAIATGEGHNDVVQVLKRHKP